MRRWRLAVPEEVRLLEEKVNILEQLVAAKDALNTSKDAMLASQRTLIADQRTGMMRQMTEIQRQFKRAERAERVAALMPRLLKAAEPFVPPPFKQMKTPAEQELIAAFKDARATAEAVEREMSEEEQG